ncbi:unnamed protein product [Prorocentrum cordatum]|uniref:Uncharacterized protein n=1 Tax=Prorocentrum cordatum TaxID=2364126 RepID=A0ABN9WS27_9DINO|nr:unnamed protein product [Polarella glacialis]
MANKKGAKAGKTAEGRRGGLRNGKADAAASEHLVLEPGSLVALLVLEPAKKKCWAAPRTNIWRRKQPQRGSPAPLPMSEAAQKVSRIAAWRAAKAFRLEAATPAPVQGSRAPLGCAGGGARPSVLESQGRISTGRARPRPGLIGPWQAAPRRAGHPSRHDHARAAHLLAAPPLEGQRKVGTVPRGAPCTKRDRRPALHMTA